MSVVVFISQQCDATAMLAWAARMARARRCGVVAVSTQQAPSQTDATAEEVAWFETEESGAKPSDQAANGQSQGDSVGWIETSRRLAQKQMVRPA